MLQPSHSGAIKLTYGFLRSQLIGHNKPHGSETENEQYVSPGIKNVAFYVLAWYAGYFESKETETMLAQDKHLLPS